MTDETTTASDDAEDEDRTPKTNTPLEVDEELPVESSEDVERDLAYENENPESAANAPDRHIDWRRIVTYGLLPATALILFMGAGYLRWMDSTARDSRRAQIESVQAARDGTVALLSYTSADVEKQMVAARDLLTGDFRNSYTSLTDDVVIPAAKQQQIKAVATVPAVSSVSASADRADALVFVDQTTTVGAGTPTDLASTVRVSMVKKNGRWLISAFNPI